ncbi:MAG: flagellum-specific ATP synthase FliI, partial [Alphaproteobacteria bacterium]|nr:flagellum-specific ATP synthase FliI [Alphaproteobacteria bacterium]
PIVDAARAIVDGHIVLSRQLSEQSIFPAIDVGKSLSRVMADVVTDEHQKAASGFRRLWAAYEENRDLILMGAYRPGNDPVIDLAVERRPDLLAFLRQDARSRIGLDASVAALQEAFGS